MPPVLAGGMTHDHDAGLVELYADPASGFLGARTLMGGRGPTLVQYWSSAEQLFAYATDTQSRHWPPSTGEPAAIRGRSGSGTRRSWSRRPSRSTPTCPSWAWRKPPGIAPSLRGPTGRDPGSVERRHGVAKGALVDGIILITNPHTLMGSFDNEIPAVTSRCSPAGPR